MIPPNNISPKDRANTRAALIRAAAKLFAEVGYEAVSTREVAEAAGVNLGAIQYYFGSKAKLFVETVHELMQNQQRSQIEASLEGAEPENAEEAALRIASFVIAHLSYLLRSEPPQACRLMCREVLSGSCKDAEMLEALVSSVTSSFIVPLENSLMITLRKLLPEAGEAELQLTVSSVVSQCTFFFSHRPFIERMRGRSLTSSPMFEEIAAHIIRFTLRATRQPESLIEKVLHITELRPVEGGNSEDRKPQKKF